METQQYAIFFHRAALRDFRAECIRRDTTPTKELNRLLEEQVAQWTGVVAPEECDALYCEPIDAGDRCVRLTIADQQPSTTLTVVGAKAVITWLGRVVARHTQTHGRMRMRGASDKKDAPQSRQERQ
jgi:hypothetical protein